MRSGARRGAPAGTSPEAGTPVSHRDMGRAIGLLYLAGAALAVVWTVLPHGSGVGDQLILMMILLATAMGAALGLGVADRAPSWVFHVCIGAIQVVISIGFVAPGVADNDIRLFYLWATPFAALFFTQRSALWHGFWTAATFAVALSVQDEPTAVLLRVFLLTMGTLASVGVLVGYIVAGMRRSQQQLQHAAWHDHLSGLPNRALFERRTTEALADRDVHGGAVHVLLVDLDHFKVVNDTYGHHAGDQLIREVGARLKGALGERATVARMGGDEFAVVVADLVGVLDLDRVLARLPEVWTEPVRLTGAVVPVSASVGVATCSEPGRTAEQLLRDADVALYRAKNTRRGSVRRFDPVLRVEVERRTRLDQELHDALARDELSLLYQPVVDLLSGRTVGAEALLRWNSPTLGPVPPAEFVPVAEENGLVVPIGAFVLAQAAADISRWRAEGAVDEQFSVAVNVSVRQLCSRFPEDLDRLLLAHGLPHSALTVEITESVLLDGSVFSGTVLSRLRRAGTPVSLDDFGTGYSSLSYLQRLPMDTLKIDRSFVGELDGPAPRTGLVCAVLDLARSLGMNVIAEGVETPEQADRLRLLGVERAQGWLFARPLRACELLRHLDKGVPLA